MIRVFIAVEIDPSTKQKISALISLLKDSNADVKWITENQMHLTLKFLGNIERDRIQEITDGLESIAADFSAFSIQFSKIGGFPDMRHPRVVWIGINEGGETLKLLNNEIEGGLQKLGFEKEKRGYKPHLTLGRVKSSKNISKLIKLINEADLEIRDRINIDKLILFQSTLAPKGAIYAPLKEYILLSFRT